MKAPVGAIALLLLLPTATIAETSAEREACTGDAFRVCWKAIPDRHGVFLCLRDNLSKLSPACRMVMAQHLRQEARSRTRAGHTSRAQADLDGR